VRKARRTPPQYLFAFSVVGTQRKQQFFIGCVAPLYRGRYRLKLSFYMLADDGIVTTRKNIGILPMA